MLVWQLQNPSIHPLSSAYLRSGSGGSASAGKLRLPSPQEHGPAPPGFWGIPRQRDIGPLRKIKSPNLYATFPSPVLDDIIRSWRDEKILPFQHRKERHSFKWIGLHFSELTSSCDSEYCCLASLACGLYLQKYSIYNTYILKNIQILIVDFVKYHWWCFHIVIFHWCWWYWDKLAALLFFMKHKALSTMSSWKLFWILLFVCYDQQVCLIQSCFDAWFSTSSHSGANCTMRAGDRGLMKLQEPDDL